MKTLSWIDYVMCETMLGIASLLVKDSVHTVALNTRLNDHRRRPGAEDVRGQARAAPTRVTRGNDVGGSNSTQDTLCQ